MKTKIEKKNLKISLHWPQFTTEGAGASPLVQAGSILDPLIITAKFMPFFHGQNKSRHLTLKSELNPKAYEKALPGI